MAASADATDKDIQDALAAVGSGAAPETGGGDADIDAALQALNVPKPRYTPDKGPADFLSGGSDAISESLKRGFGTAVGEAGMVGQGLMFLPSGIAYLAGMPFGKGPQFQKATVNALNPATDWSGDPLPATGEVGRGAQYPGQALGESLEALSTGAGNVAASLTDPRLQRPAGLAGLPSQADMARALPKPTAPQNPEQGRVQAARTEAMTRSGTEAITQAILALAGLKGGAEAVEGRGGGGGGYVPRVTKSDILGSTETTKPVYGPPPALREPILRLRSAKAPTAEDVQDLSRSVYAWLAKDPPAQHLTAAENELSLLRERVPEARETLEAALSAVRVARQSKASPGLRETPGSDVAMSGVSSRTPHGDEITLQPVVDIQQKIQPGAQPGTSTAIQPTTDFAERMAAAAPKPVPKPVKGESAPNPELEALAGQYRATAADVPATLPQLPKYLKGAKPKMGEQAITFASDLDKAAYIVANPRTASARHADYLEWLAKAMDTDENTALFMAKRSRDATVASVKAGKADVPPFLAPKRPGGDRVLSAQRIEGGTDDVVERPPTPLEQRMSAVDEALKGTALSRVNIPIGAEGFAQENHLRMGQGEGTPLGYTQFVQDVYEHPADEVLQAIGEKVFQEGKGDPTRVHLDAPTLTALQQALAARGWNPARRDRLEMLSAAYDYAMRNRQVRNEGYARMRGAIQDNDLMGEMLRSPENFAVRVRLPKFDAGRDFEKVCSP